MNSQVITQVMSTDLYTSICALMKMLRTQRQTLGENPSAPHSTKQSE